MPVIPIAASDGSDVVRDARVSGARRAAAGAVDAALLLAGLVWVVTFEFALGDDEALAWLVATWLLLVAPLYFGLYHGYGTGATPGQQDLGIAVRNARTHAPAGFARGMGGAVVGLLELVTVIPALVDAIVVVGGGRSLRERLLHLETAPFALRGTQRPLPPAAETVASLFSSTSGTSRRRRAQALVGQHMGRVFGPVLGSYLVMIGLAVVFGALVLLDAGTDWGAYDLWLLYASLLFFSGVYWTQAVVVIAVESVRRDDPVGFADTLRAAVRRLNGLAAALLVLGLLVGVLSALAFVGVGALAPLALLALLALPFALGRLALAVPSILLEDMRVTEAGAASWRRTRGRTWRLAGGIWLSGLLVLLVLGIASGAAFALVAPLTERAESGAAVVATVSLGFAIAAIPTSLLLAYLGTWWTLAYHDLREPEVETEA